MHKRTSIAKVMNDTLPPHLIRDMARRVGLVKRTGKVNFVVFFWTLIFAPAAALPITLAGLQQHFHLLSSTTIARSAFQKRFCMPLVVFLRAMLMRVLELQFQVLATPSLFSHFQQVLAVDSSLVALNQALASMFPGPRNNTAPAALKFNAVYNVLSASLKKITIAKGTRAETKMLNVGKEVAQSLLLMDLGYFSYALFDKIASNKGFFISRLKRNANPLILADNHDGPGRCRPLADLKVWDAIQGLVRNILDVDVEVVYRKKRRPTAKYPRKTAERRLKFRVVGLRHPVSGEFHLYLTNVPGEIMTPEQVRVSYTARWLVELVFDDLKNVCGMKEFPSRRREVIESLVYAAVIRFALSCHAMNSLCKRIMSATAKYGAQGEHMRQALSELLSLRARGKRFVRAWSN